MRLAGTSLDKWFDGILWVWLILTLCSYFTQAYVKKRYPRFCRLFDRFVTCLCLAIVPISAYELFLIFRSAASAPRLLMVFLAFVALIALAARWWGSQNKSAPSQS